MQRIGLATGYDPTMAIRDMVGWVAQADERGFEIGFFSETIETYPSLAPGAVTQVPFTLKPREVFEVPDETVIDNLATRNPACIRRLDCSLRRRSGRKCRLPRAH